MIWPETRERTDASDQLREPDARHHPRPCRACSSARPLVPRTPPFTVVHRRLAAFWRVARNEPASADLRKYCAPSRSPHCHEAGMPIAEGFTCRSLRPVPSLSNPYSDQMRETVRDWTWKLSRGVHRRSSKSASPVSIAIVPGRLIAWIDRVKRSGKSHLAKIAQNTCTNLRGAPKDRRP